MRIRYFLVLILSLFVFEKSQAKPSLEQLLRSSQEASERRDQIHLNSSHYVSCRNLVKSFQKNTNEVLEKFEQYELRPEFRSFPKSFSKLLGTIHLDIASWKKEISPKEVCTHELESIYELVHYYFSFLEDLSNYEGQVYPLMSLSFPNLNRTILRVLHSGLVNLKEASEFRTRMILFSEPKLDQKIFLEKAKIKLKWAQELLDVATTDASDGGQLRISNYVYQMIYHHHLYYGEKSLPEDLRESRSWLRCNLAGNLNRFFRDPKEASPIFDAIISEIRSFSRLGII